MKLRSKFVGIPGSLIRNLICNHYRLYPVLADLIPSGFKFRFLVPLLWCIKGGLCAKLSLLLSLATRFPKSGCDHSFWELARGELCHLRSGLAI